MLLRKMKRKKGGKKRGRKGENGRAGGITTSLSGKGIEEERKKWKEKKKQKREKNRK